MKIRCANRREFEAAVARLPPARSYHVVVLHDDDCTPSRCGCEPEYVVEDLTVDNYQRAAKAQSEWIRSTLS